MTTDDAFLIDELAIPHRASAAQRALMARGAAAMPTVVRGLSHEAADVRLHCCQVLDRLLTPDALAPLIGMLDDPDPRVRCSALHTLSCDRCKDEVWLPTGGPLLAKAMALLASDPDAHVRAHAVEAVGRSAHSNAAALAAIASAADADPSPAVRKKARWYAPGGAIWRRMAPKAARTPR